MGEVATDRKEEDRENDELPEILTTGTRSPSHADGKEQKEAKRNSEEPSIDTDDLVTSNGDKEVEDLHVDRVNGIEQTVDENVLASGEHYFVMFSSRPKESTSPVKSAGNQAATTVDTHLKLPPPAPSASPQEQQLEKEVPTAPAKEVERKLTEQILRNGRSPEQGPNKESLVKSGESTEESSVERSLVDSLTARRIEYFCEPNQNLTSDAWKIFLYHMLPFTTIPPLFILACLWWAYIEWGWSALLFYTSILTLLATSTPVYSRRFREAVSCHFYGLLARYVPSAQYVVPEKPFPENRPYIFACHPHGRMFYSTVIFSQLHRTWRRNILQTGDLFMTAAGMFFHVPLLRNLFYLVGVIPAGKGDIVAKLRHKDHVTILIGGVKEVMLGTEDDVDRIYLKRRKGFCKIAIQENAGVVPVYFFNENQMFMHNSKPFLKFWERVNKYFKVGVPFMRGRFLILPMPFRRPLMIAVGEPLVPNEGESVDDFHERYMKALRELFDKYVQYSPKPDHKLIIQ